MKILFKLFFIIVVLFPSNSMVFADEVASTTIEATEPVSTTTSNAASSTDVTVLAEDTENNSPVESPSPNVEDSNISSGVYITGDIIEDETWTADRGPYYISDIYIPSGVTVTVEEGVQIHAGGYIAVFGNLILNGTGNGKIIMDLNQDYDN